MDKKKSYGEMLEELEKLLAAIENPDSPLEKIAEDVKKAKVIIDDCRKSLRGTETEIQNLLYS